MEMMKICNDVRIYITPQGHVRVTTHGEPREGELQLKGVLSAGIGIRSDTPIAICMDCHIAEMDIVAEPEMIATVAGELYRLVKYKQFQPEPVKWADDLYCLPQNLGLPI